MNPRFCETTRPQLYSYKGPMKRENYRFIYLIFYTLRYIPTIRAARERKSRSRARRPGNYRTEAAAAVEVLDREKHRNRCRCQRARTLCYSRVLCVVYSVYIGERKTTRAYYVRFFSFICSSAQVYREDVCMMRVAEYPV